MLFFSNEPRNDEFSDISLNSHHDVWTEALLLLLEGLGSKLNVERVTCYLRVESGHIFVIPRKDINILHHEFYQILFFSRRQSFADKDKLRISLISQVSLDLFFLHGLFALFKESVSLRVLMFDPWIILHLD